MDLACEQWKALTERAVHVKLPIVAGFAKHGIAQPTLALSQHAITRSGGKSHLVTVPSIPYALGGTAVIAHLLVRSSVQDSAVTLSPMAYVAGADGAYAVRRTTIITRIPMTKSPANANDIQINSIKLLEPGSLMVPPYEESPLLCYQNNHDH